MREGKKGEQGLCELLKQQVESSGPEQKLTISEVWVAFCSGVIFDLDVIQVQKKQGEIQELSLDAR
jgi:hypothetical protein